MEKNTRSVDTNLGTRLRTELTNALPEAAPDVRERLARTAILSRREAQRFLVATAAEQNYPADAVERARAVIDKLAEA